MKKALPLVSIIVVNYNGKQFLKDCLDSLYALDYPQDKIEIIMVDNGSADDSLQFVKEQYPKIKIIQNDINNYCRANNLGIKKAQGEYIALLNNDVKVDTLWLREQIKVIEAGQKIGAVTSKILFMDDKRIQSTGHQEYPDFYWGDRGFQEADKGQYEEIEEVPSICGASVLYRKQCLDEIGLLDEEFFIYMDDVDMSVRCRKQKWKLMYAPRSVVYHKYMATNKKEQQDFLVERNRLLFIAKHYPEKLGEALFGRGYFATVEQEKFNEVLEAVYLKLEKFHGKIVLKKLFPEIQENVKKIKNFKKDVSAKKNYLEETHASQRGIELKKKDEVIQQKDKELRQREEEIMRVAEELKGKTAELRGKEVVISQKNQELSLRESELSLKNNLIQQKDEELKQKSEFIEQKHNEMQKLQNEISEKSSLIQQQEKEFAMVKKFQEEELLSKEILLQRIRRELNNIYTSTGYKYLLRPLWGFLWPIKQITGRQRLCLQSKVAQIRKRWERIRSHNSLVPIKQVLNQARGRIMKTDISRSLAGTYLKHIKHKTPPPNPEKLTLMINRTCNLKCKFCDIADVDQRKAILSKDDAFKIIDSAKKLGIKEIIITGGEPFLHPGLFDIVDFANSHDIKVTITTNGLFIKQYIERIQNSNIDCISVSIDGKENTHDFLRNCQGVYKKAVEAINLLRQHKINTSVNFVVTNKNVYELEEVYNFFTNLGIKMSFLPVINKPDLFPSNAEEVDIYMKFINRLLQKRLISTLDHNYLELAIKTYFNKQCIMVRCLGLNFEIGIDTDGNISPCCVWENRKPELNNLGNALKDNIEELWHSSQFYQARFSIFREGCQNCFNPSVTDLPKITGINFLLRPKRHSQNKINVGIKKTDRLMIKPSHIHMRLTSRCNLSCKHCDIWKSNKDSEKELSVVEWKHCIDKLFVWLGSFKLDLAGGEILLYKDAIHLIQYCASKGIVVNLTTNATLIDETIAERLVNSGLHCINLSVDGLAEVNDYTRNKTGAFLEVKQAVFNLLKYRKHDIPYISLATVITKYNLEQLLEIIKLPRKWGVNNSSFQALDHNFDAGYTANWFKNNEFWPSDSKKAESTIDALIAAKKSGTIINNSLRQLIAMKRYYNNPRAAVKEPCLSGVNNFIVNEFGEVLLCWNMPAAGNLLIDNPEQIWNSEPARRIRRQIEKCERTCRLLNCNYKDT